METYFSIKTQLLQTLKIITSIPKQHNKEIIQYPNTQRCKHSNQKDDKYQTQPYAKYSNTPNTHAREKLHVVQHVNNEQN